MGAPFSVLVVGEAGGKQEGERNKGWPTAHESSMGISLQPRSRARPSHEPQQASPGCAAPCSPRAAAKLSGRLLPSTRSVDLETKQQGLHEIPILESSMGISLHPRPRARFSHAPHQASPSCTEARSPSPSTTMELGLGLLET
jgi:hypothetical protein